MTRRNLYSPCTWFTEKIYSSSWRIDAAPFLGWGVCLHKQWLPLNIGCAFFSVCNLFSLKGWDDEDDTPVIPGEQRETRNPSAFAGKTGLK